jgi:hypothetical protein
VSLLDGDQAAEPATEHKDRPKSKFPTSDEEDHAEPTNGVSIKCQEVLSVAVGRQVGNIPPQPRMARLERRCGLERPDELGQPILQLLPSALPSGEGHGLLQSALLLSQPPVH